MLLPRPTRRRVAAVTAATLTAALVPMLGMATTASAAPTELFISEYVEGSSNNKALEIYNGTGAPVNLGTGGYNVQMFFNGSGSAGLTINLDGTVADQDVFVLAQAGANATILAQADQTNGSGWFNGDDAVVLRKGTAVIDVIGQIGVDPGAEWGTGLTSTADNTLRRKIDIAVGDADGANPFDPAIEWDGYAIDTLGALGAHPASDVAPLVTTSSPVDGATGVGLGDNLSVTFSEAVNVTGDWFTLACATSGSHAAVVTGGPTTFTLDPATDFAGGETCTLTVLAANVSDQDSNDPPDTLAANRVVSFTTFVNQCDLPYTPIPEIQGSGSTVVLPGTQTTEGVVVGDYEGASPALRGFFIQDVAGDGNAATSDGIFVFESSNADSVSLGDLVRVTGTAGENQGQSQISVGTIQKCGTSTVTPADVTFPVASADYLERYEGMLVNLPQTMYVTEHFQLGRFGQVVVSSGDRLQQPTSAAAPGAPALAVQAQNDLNRIIIDDASQTQNPDPILFARGGQPLSASNTLRGGDTATGIVGVLNYTWAGNSASGNAYRVRPINALNGHVEFQPTNPRPATAPELGGSLRVGGMNLLNYFNTFDGIPDKVDNCRNGVGGETTDCRGADTQAEFDRQWPKTVAAINGTGAGVVGIVEMENDGYGPESAIADLVSKLNTAAGAGTWAYIDVDQATGEVNALGTDAIKVGLIYQPAKVTPVGRTAVLNTDEFVVKEMDEQLGRLVARNRPALAQAFRENATGAIFVPVVNHLKSKGSVCDVADAGDGQGNCNAVRVQAAEELGQWLNTDPTGTGDTDMLILGDLNSYAMEDPITALTTAGFTNLIAQKIGADAYSYAFDGQWGYLDHALASASLTAQVKGVADWHINADEPSVLDYNTDFKSAGQIDSLYAPDQFRISDHDPVLVGLDLNPYTTVFANGGGWISADPTGGLPAGKGSFQFSVKYESKDAPPAGSLTYSLAGAPFVVTSTSVDWLSVIGAEATFVGPATVNGESGYRFEVTTADGGKADTFRLVVRTQGGTLVYDSGSQPVKGQVSVHD
jgi:predicted extracellular nuclease